MRSIAETINAKCTRERRPGAAPGDSGDRQPDLRQQTAPRAREQLESAVMRAYHALDDRQAETGAALVAARDFQARERPLQAIDLGGGDARAAIRHFEHDAASLGPHRDEI